MAGVFLFDMDGLLLDSERLYQAAFCDVTARMGVARDTDMGFFVTLVGSSWPATKAALDTYFEGGVDIDACAALWEDAVKDRVAAGIPLRPTVRESLEHLATSGARMAVVTSTRTPHAHTNLQKSGLLDFFEQVKGGDAVSANKPDPAPYLEAAADMGVAAGTCFAFEDSDPGITSAMAAGCNAVQIPDLRDPSRPLPDLGQKIAPDLVSALRLLEQI